MMQSAVVLLYIRILKDSAPPFGLLDTMMNVALRFGFCYHDIMNQLMVGRELSDIYKSFIMGRDERNDIGKFTVCY